MGECFGDLGGCHIHYHELLSNSYNIPKQQALIEYMLNGMQQRISDAAQTNNLMQMLQISADFVCYGIQVVRGHGGCV